MNNLHISNALPIAGGTNFCVIRAQAADDFTHQLPPCCAELSKQQCQVLSDAVWSMRNRLEDADEVPTHSRLGFEFETLTLPSHIMELPEPVRQDVCRASSKSYPDFLLIAVYAWEVPGKSASQSARLRKKYGSLRTAPNAVYAVMFVLETRAGTSVAVANLLGDPLSTRRRKFTPVQNWTDLAPRKGILMDSVVAMARLGELRNEHA